MIVAGAPLSVVERPTMSRSPPNRCCHMPWLRTTTLFLPGTSSSAVNARPSTGCTRAISKKSQDTSALLMRSAPLLPRKRARAALCRDDPLERRTLRAPVEERGRRDREAAVLRHDLVDAHQRFRLGERQRPEQHAIDHAEHRAGGADAERQCEDGHDREPGTLRQLTHAVVRVAQNIRQHLPHSCLCRVRHFDAVGQAFHPWPRVSPFRQPDVARQLVPVADLPAGMGIGLGLARAAGQGLAIEVLELRRQVPDDVRFALGRQAWQPQPFADEGLPVTHRSTPGCRRSRRRRRARSPAAPSGRAGLRS